MNKEQIMGQIKTLVEMLYLTGEKSGMETAEKIFNPKEFGNPFEGAAKSASEALGIAGSDPHPSRGFKGWSAKSFTVKIHDEDDTIEFWVDGELKNRHQSNAAAIKFEQLLMQVKDQMASWNSLEEKKEN